MLAHARIPADAALPTLVPAHVSPTLWDIAANAVMAGCAPACLPVVAAAAAAVADPASNLTGIQATTGAATPLVIVSGPIVAALAMNAGGNSLGHGSRPNATIGRALRLILQNVGLAVPGVSDMATQGQPGKYTWCVAENEADSPWPPLRVSLGFAARASVVRVVGAVGNVEVVLPATSPEDTVHTLAGSMTIEGNVGGEGTFGGGQALVLLPPESAVFLSSHGWDRRRLQRELFDRARVRYERLTPPTVARVIERRPRARPPRRGGPVGRPRARGRTDCHHRRRRHESDVRSDLGRRDARSPSSSPQSETTALARVWVSKLAGRRRGGQGTPPRLLARSRGSRLDLRQAPRSTPESGEREGTEAMAEAGLGDRTSLLRSLKLYPARRLDGGRDPEGLRGRHRVLRPRARRTW